MSINGAPSPDTMQALLAMQSLINSSASNGKPAFLFGCFPMDVNVGAGVSPQGIGLDKPICYANAAFKNRRAEQSSMMKAINAMHEQFKKISEGASVVYSGDLPSGSMPGSSGIARGGSDFELTA